MGFDFAGEYTRIVPQQLIECLFGGRSSVMEFVESAEGVRVTITFDSEPSHTEEQQRTGWQAILDNFRRHVEGRVAS